MPFSPKQRAYLRGATRKVNLAHGATRSGKTYVQCWAFLLHVAANPGLYLALGVTLGTIHRNILDDPDKGLLALMRHTAPVAYDHQQNRILWQGSRIDVIGCDDSQAETKVRGGTYSGLLVDETTLLPQPLFEQASVRCSEPGARIFATTNPDSPYHWVYRTLVQGNPERIFALHFDVRDNPSLSEEYIADLADAYIGLFHQRFILGRWVMAEGVIYETFDLFNEYGAEVGPLAVQDEVVGVDYGIIHPTVFEHVVYDKFGVYWEVDEHWYNGEVSGHQQTDGEIADDLFAFLERKNPNFRRPLRLSGGQRNNCAIFVDPSAKSLIALLRKRGLEVVFEANNEVGPGIQTVAGLYATKRLRVHRSRCPHSIEENTLYAWDPLEQRHGRTVPKKTNDHAKDAERYAVHSHATRMAAARRGPVKAFDYRVLGLVG